MREGGRILCNHNYRWSTGSVEVMLDVPGATPASPPCPQEVGGGAVPGDFDMFQWSITVKAPLCTASLKHSVFV